MIGALLGLIVLVFGGLYLAMGILALPMSIYDSIVDPVENPISSLKIPILVAILILIVLITIAYFLSKNNDYYDYKSTVKKFLLISIPVYYISILLISFLFKDTNTLETYLFKNDMSTYSRLVVIFFAHSACSGYPVLISSFVFKILAEKRMMKEFAIEQSYRNEEKRKEQEIEQANNEIEYYKKLGDLENLLKQNTITQEKFNELKSKLKVQHNIK